MVPFDKVQTSPKFLRKCYPLPLKAVLGNLLVPEAPGNLLVPFFGKSTRILPWLALLPNKPLKKC